MKGFMQHPIYIFILWFSSISKILRFFKRSCNDHTSQHQPKIYQSRFCLEEDRDLFAAAPTSDLLHKIPLSPLCLQCLEHCARKSGKSKPAITLKTQTFLKHMGIFFGPKNFCFLWEVGGGFSEWQVHWPTGEESLQN